MDHEEFQSEYWKRITPLMNKLEKLERIHKKELKERQENCSHLGGDGLPKFKREYLMCDEWGDSCQFCGKLLTEEEIEKLGGWNKGYSFCKERSDI